MDFIVIRSIPLLRNFAMLPDVTEAAQWLCPVFSQRNKVTYHAIWTIGLGSPLMMKAATRSPSRHNR